MTASIALIVLALMTFIASLVPAPYVIESAGPTVDVLGEVEGTPVISVAGERPETGSGQLRMTTVSVQGAPGKPTQLPAVFLAWFNHEKSVMPREAVYPDVNDAEGNKLMTTVQMSSSQQEAIAVALREQGIDYTTTVVVAGVRTDGPAATLLKAGDEVISVNGVSSQSVDELQKATAATPAGGTAEFVVKRDGKEQHISIPVAQKDGTSIVGIMLSRGYQFPREVTIALDGIGGPSAGLMFSLGIYALMTEGDFTGGRKIAGTGTIAEDGTVGPIGGIRQKMVGARKDGAEFFLAPAENCPEVPGHIPDGLTVVKVSTFTEAKHAVETIARTGTADGLPTCGS